MTLLHCPKCGDVLRLRYTTPWPTGWHHCYCGDSGATLRDERWGNAVIIIVEDDELRSAIRFRNEDDESKPSSFKGLVLADEDTTLCKD